MRHVLTIPAVEDLAVATRFCDAAFGWRRAVEVPVYVEYALPGGAALGLYQRRSFSLNTGVVPTPAAPGAITGTELYFRCDDLAPAVARLQAAGARLLSPPAPRDWGDDAAYFADPDGNVLVLAVPTRG